MKKIEFLLKLPSLFSIYLVISYKQKENNDVTGPGSYRLFTPRLAILTEFRQLLCVDDIRASCTYTYIHINKYLSFTAMETGLRVSAESHAELCHLLDHPPDHTSTDSRAVYRLTITDGDRRWKHRSYVWFVSSSTQRASSYVNASGASPRGHTHASRLGERITHRERSFAVPASLNSAAEYLCTRLKSRHCRLGVYHRHFAEMPK